MTPRVRVEIDGLPRPIDAEVGELLASGRPCLVQLYGQRGAGLTTALRHTAAALPDRREILLLDTHEQLPTTRPRVTLQAVDGRATAPAKVRAGAPDGADADTLHWTLAEWSDDDCMEYLMAAHPARVANAFAAWRLPSPRHDLQRWPGLCRRVLDKLASVAQSAELAAGTDALCALAFVLEDLLGHRRAAARDYALRSFLPADQHDPGRSTAVPAIVDQEPQLLRSRSVRALLAAESLVRAASQRSDPPFPPRAWPADLAAAIGHLVQIDAPLLQHLLGLATRSQRQPGLLLSVLCAAERGFRPPRAQYRDLVGARLPGVILRNKRLSGDCSAIDLDGADLDGANLDDCDLTEARLRRADLGGARLVRARADRVQGDGLVARKINGVGLRLVDASLRDARLDEAALRNAHLERTDLSGASLVGSDLRHARLDRVLLAQCDLARAHLEDSTLEHLDLRTAHLAGASMHRVHATRCRFDGVDLGGLRAERAVFSHCDFTLARLSGARLRGSRLHGCGLFGVDLQGADLREVDFRDVSFHLGNSRSGLVESTTAGEGSRTGFYTDEALEDAFQAPEDVRKANLRDCDLRGAWLTDVDLYLVDLRGALLDPRQRDHARACRAILDRSFG